MTATLTRCLSRAEMQDLRLWVAAKDSGQLAWLLLMASAAKDRRLQRLVRAEMEARSL